MIQPGLNLFEMLDRKTHSIVLWLGGLVNLSLAAWFFALRNNNGIFGLMNIDNIQSVLPWLPEWYIQFHRSPFGLWFHIIVLTMLGLAVIWEGIKMWKTGR